MSLDKAIKHMKEHRKEYHGAKSVDKRCRNHGDCEWCKANRMYRAHKNEENAKQQEDEYARGE